MIASRITREGNLHRWNKGTRDEAGDYEPLFDPPVPVRVEVQQVAAFEQRDGRQVQVVVWQAYFPPDVTGLTGNDEVELDGLGRFAFDGDPWLVRNPRTGVASHWQARARKVG